MIALSSLSRCDGWACRSAMQMAFISVPFPPLRLVIFHYLCRYCEWTFPSIHKGKCFLIKMYTIWLSECFKKYISLIFDYSNQLCTSGASGNHKTVREIEYHLFLSSPFSFWTNKGYFFSKNNFGSLRARIKAIFEDFFPMMSQWMQVAWILAGVGFSDMAISRLRDRGCTSVQSPS